jgi:inorganic triphosphatase YgiF
VPLEVELKLTIAPKDVAALARAAPIKTATLGRATTSRLYSIYYDTPQFALRESKVALRMRRTGKRWVQTLKSAGRVDAGLHQREEIETPLAAQILNYRVLSESNAAPILSDPQLPLQLAPVFVTDFKRTARQLQPATGTQIELALDRGTITAGAAQAPISEVELELKSGPPAHLIDLALALVEQVPMRLSPASKAERGYALAAGTAPIPVKARPVELSDQLSVAAALRAIVFACIEQLQANEQGLLESDDIEYVHQARVAVRRLRSAFSVFRPAFPRILFERQLTELQWLAQTLGQARDWDVLMTETLPTVCKALPEEAALHELMERCVGLRATSRRAAQEAIASKRYTVLLLELGGAFLRAPWMVSADEGVAERDRPLFDFAGAVLADRHRNVVKRGDELGGLSAAQLHQLRIRVKKLRYAAEFFSTLFDRKEVRDYIAALARLQELLGALNDVATAEQIALALRDDQHDNDLEGLGLLRGWCAARAQDSRTRLPKAWKRFEACDKFW